MMKSSWSCKPGRDERVLKANVSVEEYESVEAKKQKLAMTFVIK